LPVIASGLVSRSGPGVTASARLPLLGGASSWAVLLRSRRSPGAIPRRAAPLSNAVARRPGAPWSPARSIGRPSPSRRRTDRSGRLSCGFARIPSTFAGRAVPSGGCRPPDHPASALVRDASRHPSRGRRIALAVFLPRVSVSDQTLCAFRAPFEGRAGGDAARAGHSCLVFFGQRTFRARARAGSRGLAGGALFASRPCRRRPWDLLITLRSLGPASLHG
jgi:hypothetical protein